MIRTNDILYKIITKQDDFCCLCHKQINNNKIGIEDEVSINNTIGGVTLKVMDILQYVLGNYIGNSVSAFQCLCKKCANMAIKCYTFLIMAKENCEVIKKYVDGLTDQLDGSNYFDGTKSLFIVYDSENNTYQKYYDQVQMTSTLTAAKRLNLLNEDTKIEIKHEPNYLDFEYTEYNEIKKKKRKHYADSIQLKTRDMLYNKYDKSTFKCKTCLKVYPSLSNLRNHFIRVHAPKNYKCSLCNKKFGSLSLVEAHEDESHCTFVCKDCGKTFNNRHSLKVHEVAHYRVEIVCPDCGRVYKSRSTFKKHIDLNICGQKTRASPANAKFTCDYCNKKYTQKVSLRVHIQYEHGNYKSHECKWCKKKFFAQSRLKAHIVKHTQEKKFSCTTCGGKFVSKESLLYHTRIHTGEKPYKCELCDKRFLSVSRRTDHRKRHHSTELYQCKMCNVKYSTQICLQKHMKSHDSQSNEAIDSCNNEGVG